jgi:hypothetical protein
MTDLVFSRPTKSTQAVGSPSKSLTNRGVSQNLKTRPSSEASQGIFEQMLSIIADGFRAGDFRLAWRLSAR